MEQKKRNKKKERRMKKSKQEKYGELIGVPTEELPLEHRATKGGLRCFKKKFTRVNGNVQKDLPKSRCGNSTAKGSLYCTRHGGGNKNSLVHGKRSTVLFKNAYSSNLGAIFDSFLKDPNILDHKRELATLRTLLISYIDKYKDNEPIKNPRKLVKLMTKVLESDHMSEHEQYYAVKEIVDNETELLDGPVIDRIAKLVDSIGKGIDRIEKIERKSDFVLTPEGFKLVMNQFSVLLNDVVKDKEVLKTIYEGLCNLHTATVKQVDVKVNDAIDVTPTDG